MAELDVLVLGNNTLDVILYPIDDVPRDRSLAFQQVAVSAGGCASNTAVGLAALGLRTGLVGCVGADAAGDLAMATWQRFGVDTRFVARLSGVPTAVSVGLVDSAAQPRFLHIPAANAHLTVDRLDVAAWLATGARWLHVGGFLITLGLLDVRVAEVLAQMREAGWQVSLDIVRAHHGRPLEALWAALPYVDVFFCNQQEAHWLTGAEDPAQAAQLLRERGAGTVIVKLGAAGCWLASAEVTRQVPGVPAQVLDTTGAGDAFAAGFIAARLRGAEAMAACAFANRVGAGTTEGVGALTLWENSARVTGLRRQISDYN